MAFSVRVEFFFLRENQFMKKVLFLLPSHVIPMEDFSEHIMDAIAKGDEAAFERLFREMYTRLCVYAESLVRDHAQAEDMVQGVFCNLWEKREKLDVSVSVSSYLFKAVYHEALNVLKHERVKADFARFIEERGEQSENNVENFFLRESRDEVVAEINRAIDSLPEQCREILLLSRFSGKKSADIAELLHLSVRTVETQLYRAMKQLRVKLKHLRNTDVFLFLHFRK